MPDCGNPMGDMLLGIKVRQPSLRHLAKKDREAKLSKTLQALVPLVLRKSTFLLCCCAHRITSSLLHPTLYCWKLRVLQATTITMCSQKMWVVAMCVINNERCSRFFGVQIFKIHIIRRPLQKIDLCLAEFSIVRKIYRKSDVNHNDCF